MRLPSSSLVLTQSLFASHDEPIISSSVPSFEFVDIYRYICVCVLWCLYSHVSSGLMIQTKNPSSDPDKVLIDLRQWISGSYLFVGMYAPKIWAGKACCSVQVWASLGVKGWRGCMAWILDVGNRTDGRSTSSSRTNDDRLFTRGRAPGGRQVR